MRLYNVTDALG